jgi:hypothetical protein
VVGEGAARFIEVVAFSGSTRGLWGFQCYMTRSDFGLGDPAFQRFEFGPAEGLARASRLEFLSKRVGWGERERQGQRGGRMGGREA